MWLVLTEPQDPCAAWLIQGLSKRAHAPVIGITTADLARAEVWEHRLSHGHSQSRVKLANGQWLDSNDTGGVVNRLLRLPPSLVQRVRASDQSYAAQEWGALWISWLHSLGNVVMNPPSPAGLSGQPRHPLEWQSLAAKAGFTVRPQRYGCKPPPSTASTPPGAKDENHLEFIVAGSRVCLEANRVVSSSNDSHKLPAAVTETLTRSARLLSALAETPLLGLRLSHTNNGWVWCGATPWPDLRRGGEPVLDAIVEHFTAASADISIRRVA